MNHSPYVIQCVQSILNQTYENLEILYLDNNSSDDSYDKVLSLLNPDKRFKEAIKNSSTISLPANLNMLIKKATGKYVCAISGDDWFDILNVEEKVEYLEENSQYAMVYGSGKFYFEDTDRYQSYPVIAPQSSNVFQQLMKSNFIFPIGAIVRRSVFEKVGYYDETLSVEDWEMWLRIAKHYPIGFQNKELVYYRRHSASFARSMSKKVLDDTMKVIKMYMPFNKNPIKAWSYYMKLRLVYLENPFVNRIIRIAKGKRRL